MNNIKTACVILLLLILLICCKASFAQAVTAYALPTPISAPVAAVAPQTLGDMASQAIFAVVSAFLLFVTGSAKALIQQYTKKAMHERGTAVIKDALYSAIDECNTSLKAVLETPDTKAKVKIVWSRISIARLGDLNGFKKSDLDGWVTEQQSIILGKLAA